MKDESTVDPLMMMEGCFSDRRPAFSGVPQGWLPRPILFVIYLNYLDENLQAMVCKFAMVSKWYQNGSYRIP